jgi:hypothetical protein
MLSRPAPSARFCDFSTVEAQLSTNGDHSVEGVDRFTVWPMVKHRGYARKTHREVATKYEDS